MRTAKKLKRKKLKKGRIAEDYETEKEKVTLKRATEKEKKWGRQKEKEGKRESGQKLWGLGLCRGGVWFGKRRDFGKRTLHLNMFYFLSLQFRFFSLFLLGEILFLVVCANISLTNRHLCS